MLFSAFILIFFIFSFLYYHYITLICSRPCSITLILNLLLILIINLSLIYSFFLHFINFHYLSIRHPHYYTPSLHLALIITLHNLLYPFLSPYIEYFQSISYLNSHYIVFLSQIIS